MSVDPLARLELSAEQRERVEAAARDIAAAYALGPEEVREAIARAVESEVRGAERLAAGLRAAGYPRDEGVS